MPPSWMSGYTGTCSYPHGWITVFLQIFAIAAMICSINVLWSCDYLHVRNGASTFDSQNTTTTTLGIGFLRRQEQHQIQQQQQQQQSSSSFSSSTNECVTWKFTSAVDAPWMAGRIFSIASTSLVVMALFPPLFMTCYIMTRRFLLFGSILYLLAAILEMLTLISMTSSLCEDASSCQAGPGLYYAIAASILQLLTGCLLRSIPAQGDGTVGHSARTLRDIYVPPVPGSIVVSENV